MAPDRNDGPPGTGFERDLEYIFEGMAQPELERLTVDAIRQYRTSVALVETAWSEWMAARADAVECAERLAELQYVHRQAEIEHRARQLVLNSLVDRLGYVPKVPAG